MVARTASLCSTIIVVHVAITYTKSVILTGTYHAAAFAVRLVATSAVPDGGIEYIVTAVFHELVSIYEVSEYRAIYGK